MQISQSFENRPLLAETHGPSRGNPLGPAVAREFSWRLPAVSPDAPVVLISEQLRSLATHNTLIECIRAARSELGVPPGPRDRVTEMALHDALQNALIHGVLEIERSEHFQKLVFSDPEGLVRHICALKPRSGGREIRVRVEATAETLTVTIMDGGGMTPQLMKQRLEKLADRERLTDIPEDQMTEEDRRALLALFETPSGNGLGVIKAGFDHIEGLHGGVKLVKYWNRPKS